jgi:DoxX-like family
MPRALYSTLIRMPLAAVWLYQGLWCKLLGHAAHQAGIVAGIPRLNAEFILPAIGVMECAFSAWVLAGWKPFAAAVTQTLLLAGMNIAGIVWSGRLIADPAGMLLQNAAFLTLAWIAAKEPNA